MKRLSVLALFAGVAFLGLAVESKANGLFRRHSGCDSCAAAPCAAAPCAPAPCAPAPAPVVWEDRKVTKYKSVIVEKEVEALVCKTATKEEKYTYTVCVPVTKQEKRKEIVCTPVSKEVDYTYTVLVPKTVTKEIMCTTYTCVTEMVKECVPVCKTVCVTCVDECGRCHTRRERVTVMEERTRCVTKRIPLTEKKLVNVTVCEPVQHKGKKTICEIVRSEREVLVNVCSYVNEKREGTRTVCFTVTEKVKRKVNVCQTVAYEETIKVAVGGCAAPCSTCSDCGHERHRLFSGGLFRRSHGCESCSTCR